MKEKEEEEKDKKFSDGEQEQKDKGSEGEGQEQKGDDADAGQKEADEEDERLKKFADKKKEKEKPSKKSKETEGEQEFERGKGFKKEDENRWGESDPKLAADIMKRRERGALSRYTINQGEEKNLNYSIFSVDQQVLGSEIPVAVERWSVKPEYIDAMIGHNVTGLTGGVWDLLLQESLLVGHVSTPPQQIFRDKPEIFDNAIGQMAVPHPILSLVPKAEDFAKSISHGLSQLLWISLGMGKIGEETNSSGDEYNAWKKLFYAEIAKTITGDIRYLYTLLGNKAVTPAMVASREFDTHDLSSHTVLRIPKNIMMDIYNSYASNLDQPTGTGTMEIDSSTTRLYQAVFNDLISNNFNKRFDLRTFEDESTFIGHSILEALKEVIDLNSVECTAEVNAAKIEFYNRHKGQEQYIGKNFLRNIDDRPDTRAALSALITQMSGVTKFKGTYPILEDCKIDTLMSFLQSMPELFNNTHLNTLTAIYNNWAAIGAKCELWKKGRHLSEQLNTHMGIVLDKALTVMRDHIDNPLISVVDKNTLLQMEKMNPLAGVINITEMDFMDISGEELFTFFLIIYYSRHLNIPYNTVKENILLRDDATIGKSIKLHRITNAQLHHLRALTNNVDKAEKMFQYFVYIEFIFRMSKTQRPIFELPSSVLARQADATTERLLNYCQWSTSLVFQAFNSAFHLIADLTQGWLNKMSMVLDVDMGKISEIYGFNPFFWQSKAAVISIHSYVQSLVSQRKPVEALRDFVHDHAKFEERNLAGNSDIFQIQNTINGIPVIRSAVPTFAFKPDIFPDPRAFELDKQQIQDLTIKYMEKFALSDTGEMHMYFYNKYAEPELLNLLVNKNTGKSLFHEKDMVRKVEIGTTAHTNIISLEPDNRAHIMRKELIPFEQFLKFPEYLRKILDYSTIVFENLDSLAFELGFFSYRSMIEQLPWLAKVYGKMKFPAQMVEIAEWSKEHYMLTQKGDLRNETEFIKTFKGMKVSPNSQTSQYAHIYKISFMHPNVYRDKV